MPESHCGSVHLPWRRLWYEDPRDEKEAALQRREGEGASRGRQVQGSGGGRRVEKLKTPRVGAAGEGSGHGA